MTEQNENRNQSQDRYGRTVTGLFFVAVGLLLLAYKMGVAFIPSWIFTWPCILIIIGIYTGIKTKFKNFSWVILTAIGTIFLIDQQTHDLNLNQYILPIAFIGIGLIFITRPRNRWKDEYRMNKHYWKNHWREAMTAETQNVNTGDGEFVEINSVFGGAKKIIFSKNFKGAEINCFMGGAELDLSQADIQGTVTIEANQVFGGTKLIIPPHWDLKVEITSVFGGVEDKRPPVATTVDTTKVLILKGTSVFGGIDIRSF